MTTPDLEPRAPSFDELTEAIRASWTCETTANLDAWTPERPSTGQCDVSSYVAWEYFGGELVLSKVMVDGEQREHHYSNRIDGREIDLTVDQFDGRQEIVEIAALSSDEIRARSATMRAELADRIAALRRSVVAQLAARLAARLTAQ